MEDESETDSGKTSDKYCVLITYALVLKELELGKLE